MTERQAEKPMNQQFEELREKVRAAGAHRWDDIPDPDAFIREMRGAAEEPAPKPPASPSNDPA